MANLRIDNLSGDTVTVFINDKEYTVNDEERVTVDALEKGSYRLRVHRTRIPVETEDYHETENSSLSEKMGKTEQSQHVQLDGIFDVNINSSKAVITVKTKVRAKEKFGVDAVFSGYTVEVSGAKTEKEKQTFPSEKLRKRFIRHQIKEAFLPVGAGGIFLMILGLIALSANIAGKSVNIGGRDFSYPWSIGLIAVSLGFIGYTVFVIVNIFKNANQFKE